MKYLIVNADDFGATPGINRGICEAHKHGILTSTSLLVDRPWTQEAVELYRNDAELSDLSVGLHVDLKKQMNDSPDLYARVRNEVRNQLRRFEHLMGCPPSHVDSHHNVHRDPSLLPFFLEVAREECLPLREHSPVRYFSKFYGQWNGETHLEQISAGSLGRMLQTEIGEGITELSCHPGYFDSKFASGYGVEREAELRALCDPSIRGVLAAESIELASYHDLASLLAGAVL